LKKIRIKTADQFCKLVLKNSVCEKQKIDGGGVFIFLFWVWLRHLCHLPSHTLRVSCLLLSMNCLHTGLLA
jgi:hypothetical protein